MESTKYGENVLPGKGEIKAMKYTINLLRPVQTYTDIEIMARKVAKLGRRREMCKAQNAVFARLIGDHGREFESRVTHHFLSLKFQRFQAFFFAKNLPIWTFLDICPSPHRTQNA